MDFEEEKNIQEEATNQPQETNHEGTGRPTGNYQREYHANGRPQRPRIHTQRAYSSEQGRTDGGFRPEGFGAGLQGGNQKPRPYRPRFNNAQGEQGEGGYQPRSYQPRQQGGHQPRQRFNQGEGGYQSRQPGYQPRPRFNAQNSEYKPQPRAPYRPRYNYQDNEEFNRNDYQPRQQGEYTPQGRPPYRPRYNNQGEGDYQPRQQGGYQQRQQRGYQPRQRTQGYDPNAKYSMKKRIEYNEEHIDLTAPIRLNKFLANAGVCSRREADEFILAGNVTVNGEVVKELGTKVLRTDEIMFRDKPVTLEKKVYVLLNKPKDYVTTSDDPQQRKTVMDLVKDVCPERIYPVGRLDRNTTGVLLLTNDGDLASKLTHPSFLKKKVYHVFLDKNVTAHDMQLIAEGIELEDGEIHADAIEYPDERDKSQIGIEIHSGKNRIVRRIFEHLGYRVVKLDRVQFAGLTKKNLRRGDWRFLTEKEVEMLRMGAFE